MNSAAPAGRTRRLLATLIDVILLAVLSTLLVLVTGLYAGPAAYDSVIAFTGRLVLVTSVAYILLNGYLLVQSSQTVGKRLLALTLCDDASGQALSLQRQLLRAALVPVFILVPYATILILIDPLLILGKSRRCLRDYITGSTVLQLEG
jgi:uncharacterized RDD family membrane protein YckC